jgi:hypothetical protein
MASIDDVINRLDGANGLLQQINGDLGQVNVHLASLEGAVNALKTMVTQGFATVSQELQQVIQLQAYTNQALYHISQQDDTIICILEHISKNTCALLNEAHTQTELQTTMRDDMYTLLDMFKTVHPDAAIESERLAKLRRQLLDCCPPEPPGLSCTYQPCPAPEPVGKPPVVAPGPLPPK